MIPNDIVNGRRYRHTNGDVCRVLYAGASYHVGDDEWLAVVIYQAAQFSARPHVRSEADFRRNFTEVTA